MRGDEQPGSGGARRSRLPLDSNLLRHRLKEVGVVTSGALAVAAGVAQLAVTGPGRLVLVMLSIGAGIFLCIRLVQGYFLDQIHALLDEIEDKEKSLLAEIEERETALLEQIDIKEKLTRTNEEQGSQIQLYRAALERIIARQYYLFDEAVDITVTVGATANEDLIVERHRTTPKPFLVHRLVRLITAVDSAVTTFAEMGVQWDGPEEETQMALLPVSETGRGVQLLIVFQPGIESEFEWSLTYRPPRIWDALREHGVDFLRWTPLRSENSPEDQPFTSLTVHFFFPAGFGGKISERYGRGSLSVETTQTGQREITWTEKYLSPGARYEWDLLMANPGRQRSSSSR